MSNDNYVAIGPHAWGSGPHETKAFRRMVANLSDSHYGADDTLVVIYHVEGDWEIDGMGRFSADEITSETHYRVDNAQLNEVSELLGDLGLKAEEALVDAEQEDAE